MAWTFLRDAFYLDFLTDLIGEDGVASASEEPQIVPPAPIFGHSLALVSSQEENVPNNILTLKHFGRQFAWRRHTGCWPTTRWPP